LEEEQAEEEVPKAQELGTFQKWRHACNLPRQGKSIESWTML